MWNSKRPDPILIPTKGGNYKLQYAEHTYWCNWQKTIPNDYRALRIWYCSKRSGKKCKVFIKTLHGRLMSIHEPILIPTKGGNYKLMYEKHTYWCNWRKSKPTSQQNDYRALKVWYCSKRSGKKCKVYLKTLYGNLLSIHGEHNH
ncbi:unnamed protein product, partial [Iphiclides podalirius]